MTAPVLVIGAGRLATALSGGLRLAGAPVVGLWGRRPAAAREAAERAGVPPVGDDHLATALAGAEVVFFAVSDRAIGEVAGGLAARGALGRRHVCLHGSGARAAHEALAPLAGVVRGLGTLHLLRAIPDGAAAMADLAGTYMAVEGDAAGRREAEALGRLLGGRLFEVPADGMAAYHAAASLASNFVVALLDAAAELASEAGISADAAPEALAALARGSVEHAGQRGPTDALTGPIRRGDRATVARHLEAIAGAPELLAIYGALGRRAVAIARRHGDVAPEALDAIAALLPAAPGE